MNPFINTQGFAKIGMMTVMVGAVVNIILDPIFIFGLNLGLKELHLQRLPLNLFQPFGSFASIR